MDLLNYLSVLDSKGIKFALSNVIEHKGAKHKLLESWINEHNYKEFDCKTFFYHYQSKNWLINGQPITDWQALIEKWIHQDATNKKTSSNGKSSSFKGRDYDFEQIENELLSN